MNNITPKNPSSQNKQQNMEAAKAEWKQKEEHLLKSKSDLGYAATTWDDFLKIEPNIVPDTVIRSNIIALQEEYKQHEQQGKIIFAEDNVVEELNKKHAVIHTGQTYIMTFKKNALVSDDFSLESRQSFKNYYEDEIIECPNGKYRSKADIWLKNPYRIKYSNIVFDPTTTESKDGYYNLWKGFACKAKRGDCSKFWAHVRDNICDENDQSYVYVRKWLASIFQKPDVVHTALVLCGSQGVGKNCFVEPLGVLFGSHYVLLSSMSELVSNFNYHLKNAVLIHANEALWGGNKKDIGAIKAMITEKRCLIEGKGKDRIMVKNYKHIILSSNEDWPVHLDPDDRRFFVLRVSEQHKEDRQYFKALQEELDNGGYEALLYDLLNEDLTGFEPRQLPSTNQII